MSGPSIQAFRFVIDGEKQQYDAFIQIIEDAIPYLECRYQPVGVVSDKWTFLTGPNLLNVSDEVDFDKAIAIINNKIAEVFKSAGPIPPLTGIAHLKWLVQVGIKEVGNVISRI